MTDRLSWSELSTLKPGACVAFGVEHRALVRGALTVTIPVGTVCVVEEQGLNEIWGGLIVRPIDAAIRQTLSYHQDAHDGCVFINDNPGALDTLAEQSPFVLDDSCPMDCI